jgi:hypothetical protein
MLRKRHSRPTAVTKTCWPILPWMIYNCLTPSL